jgi:hypothetical protein
MDAVNTHGANEFLDIRIIVRDVLARPVNDETQRLLDAAVKCQYVSPWGSIEEWARRLADDVKDAGD